MASVALHGTGFEYSEDGSGEPLVFVHGSASDYRTWQGQHAAFARHFRTIVYSRRYHWPNEPIPAGVDYSMAGHVEDLKALLHLLDAAPAHLVGHSYAELLGSGFSALRADQVRSVQAPTLLVTGARSVDLFHRLTDRLDALLLHAERVEIPNALHSVHEDNASAYNAAVLGFLARHR